MNITNIAISFLSRNYYYALGVVGAVGLCLLHRLVQCGMSSTGPKAKNSYKPSDKDKDTAVEERTVSTVQTTRNDIIIESIISTTQSITSGNEEDKAVKESTVSLILPIESEDSVLTFLFALNKIEAVIKRSIDNQIEDIYTPLRLANNYPKLSEEMKKGLKKILEVSVHNKVGYLKYAIDKIGAYLGARSKLMACYIFHEMILGSSIISDNTRMEIKALIMDYFLSPCISGEIWSSPYYPIKEVKEVKEVKALIAEYFLSLSGSRNSDCIESLKLVDSKFIGLNWSLIPVSEKTIKAMGSCVIEEINNLPIYRKHPDEVKKNINEVFKKIFTINQFEKFLLPLTKEIKQAMKLVEVSGSFKSLSSSEVKTCFICLILETFESDFADQVIVAFCS